MTGPNWKSKARTNLAILSVIAILSSLLAGSSTLAQGPELTPPDQDEGSAGALGWGDDGISEVGVEWINIFTQCPANNLTRRDDSAEGLYNKLRGIGWTGRFHWGNCNAYETDFKRAALGGHENTWADSVDIALISSHGSGGYSMYFGCKHTDCHLTPVDGAGAYGDKDLEWLAFDGCSTLNSRGAWFGTMNGLHLLLGTCSTAYDVALGSRWADYLKGYKFLWWWVRPPYKVYKAWFEAGDDKEPSGVCMRVIAEVHNNYNDYIWGKGYVSGDPAHDGYYWYWDHWTWMPAPVQVQNVEAIETMPVYQIEDREVDENYVLEIAPAFNMTGTVEDVGTDGEYYYLLNATGVETHTLQVDIASGHYVYQDLSDIGFSPVETPTLPLEDDAITLADAFFTDEGAGLPGAAYLAPGPDVLTEEVVEVEVTTSEAGVLQEEEVSRMPVNLSVSYGRVITPEVQVQTALGLRLQEQPLSIVGPGARTKMYLGDAGKQLSVRGGSCDIQTTGDVTIMDAGKAWDLFLADPNIALDPIPWVYDVVTKTAQTLAYYEQSHTESQEDLIPVWVFTADFYAGGEPLGTGVQVNVPAAEAYLPPEVSIESPTAGAKFMPGEPVAFRGSVVQFGNPPFTYEWLSSHDGVLGSGATITVPLTTAIREGEVVSQTISLKVTDANAQQGGDMTMVFVGGRIYLPVVLKSG